MTRVNQHGERLCEWCLIERDVMPKTGLCRRCNQTRKEAVIAQRKADDLIAKGVDLCTTTDGFDIRLALKKVEMAKREGLRYGPREPDDDMGMGMDLEHLLADIAAVVEGRPHLYGHAAGLLEDKFSVDEQRKIHDLLAPLGRKIFRR